MAKQGSIIRRKCNQKCIDMYNKKIKIKPETPVQETSTQVLTDDVHS